MGQGVPHGGGDAVNPMVDGTPVYEYTLNGSQILVKREDLCCPYPGPSFSKIRGVFSHIAKRREDTIGVLDTYHSKAGWAVSYVCKYLGKKAVNYWPKYVADSDDHLRGQQKQAQALGADLISLPAGRSFLLHHAAARHLRENYPGSYLMPNALKLSESVTENAEEARRTKLPPFGTVVISISSGTVAAGVMSGLMENGDYKFILHMGYDRPETAIRKYIGEMGSGHCQFDLINEKYNYKDEAPKGTVVPFPCNAHYDAKTWAWLSKPGVIENLKPPVIFWNIGS